MPHAWTIRAAQLDLARQRETVPTILRFIDFLSESGLNTLVLYLEGVVRTAHFPWRGAEESYTPEQMRQVAEAAGRAGVEVVPVIASLGHAEHFVQCPQLRHLALKPGFLGAHSFDPSQEETYRFLEDYLGDIHEIFPGTHLHVGLDEAWPLGRHCLEKGRPFGEVFVEHLLRMHDICGRLSRRMWIWEDLFEFLSDDQIRRVPRDVMLCHWHYELEAMDEDGMAGHFNNRHRRDWLAFYGREGFDTLICPAAGGLDATVRLTELGRRHGRVVGGLQTIWELRTKFLPGLLPGVALAGALWSDSSVDGPAAMRKMKAGLFPDADPAAAEAIDVALTQPLWPRGAGSLQTFLRGPMGLQEHRWARSVALALEALAPYRDGLSDSREKLMTDELYAALEWQSIFGRLRRLLPQVVNPRRLAEDGAVRRRRVGNLQARIENLAEFRQGQWAHQRPGLGEDRASAPLRVLKELLTPMMERAGQPGGPTEALLVLRLFLYECHSAPRMRVEVRQGGEYRLVVEGTFKPIDLSASHYTIQTPFVLDGPPDSIRISVWGYGGQGVSHVAIRQARCDWTASSVQAVDGMVDDPEALLRNDPFPSWFGSRDTVEGYLQGKSDDTASVEVLLKQTPLDGGGA